MVHEYLHHAAESGKEIVPENLRGKFPRGSEKFFRQHAWIWGESANIHNRLRKAGGETAVGFGQADFFTKMADYYNTHNFEDFVKYIKRQGLDLY